jgi:protoporphyrinogen oxidase
VENPEQTTKLKSVSIIGGGFCGLAAAYDLAKAGVKVKIFERDKELGGLAGVFEVSPGCFLEKFYHHWFSSDRHIIDWCKELGIEDKISFRKTNTGLYFSNTKFRLSSPLDLLTFKPLSLISRIRTGIMVLLARRINDYKKLEDQTAEEWICKTAGKESYEIVWRPLLSGKFGPDAKDVSAVWFWNKIKLRGSSRGDDGGEQLAYIDGGFKEVIKAIEGNLKSLGVEVYRNTPIKEIKTNQVSVESVITESGQEFKSDKVLVTTPLPTFTSLCPTLSPEYRSKINQIRFLGNICLVLILDRSLSDTYWLNVADPDFPFVGIIEHTNFDPPERFGGKHIVYLSKYLSTKDERYSYTEEQLWNYALPYISRMFPEFSPSWVTEKFLWREPYSQPLITEHYSELIPSFNTPIENLHLATMAQVYPEDRGTNYAVREGRLAARKLLGL